MSSPEMYLLLLRPSLVLKRRSLYEPRAISAGPSYTMRARLT